MRTSVYEAQNRLYDALKASPAFASVRVSLGNPGSFQKEEVYIGGEVEDWNIDYRQSGLVSRDEQYTLRIYCYASKTGKNYVTARDRVKELSDAVEDVIAADPTLGGLSMLTTVTQASLDEGISSDGRTRMVLETLGVRIRAHVNAG